MIVKRVAVLKVFPTGTCTFTLVSVFQTVKELIFKTIYSCKNIIERGRHLRHLVQPHWRNHRPDGHVRGPDEVGKESRG